VNSIVQILNAHLNSLQWIGQQMDTINVKLGSAEKQLTSVRATQDRQRQHSRISFDRLEEWQ